MLIAAADGLHPNAVPFPFRDVVGRIEIGEIGILDRMRQHDGAERGGIEVDGFFAAAFQPREQIEIGRREPRPHQLDIVGVLVAKLCRCGLGEPRGNADAHRAGHEFEQRPSSGLVQLIEPAGKLSWQFRFAERAERGDDFGESGWRVVVAGLRVVVAGRRVVVAGRRDVVAGYQTGGRGHNALPSLHARAARGKGQGRAKARSRGRGVGGAIRGERLAAMFLRHRPLTPDPSPPLRGGREVDRRDGHISATVSERSPT